MNTPRQKSDLLTNIETLWQDAEHSADNQAKSTFDRISNLMQDAITSEIVANDALPPDSHDTPVSEETQVADERQASEMPSAEDAAHIDALAALVDTASHPAASTANQKATPPSFEDAKARMDSISQLKPPHQDNFNAGTPEYAFGAAFSDLVRHVVRDYIHNEVEGVIKNAIKSELDNHFKSHDEDNTT